MTGTSQAQHTFAKASQQKSLRTTALKISLVESFVVQIEENASLKL